jgi:hypothetical protein
MIALSLLLVALVHPPAVIGPRATTDPTPTYRFVTRQHAIRFRCSFDRPRLHPCSSPYTRRLSVGRHVLRVRSVDRRGLRSATKSVAIRILEPGGPRVQTIRVSGRPVSLAEGFGSIWVANYLGGAVLRLDPATNRVVARIPVGDSRGGSP